KPKTDDMREAPSRTIIKMLTTAGAKIVAYDPVAMDEAKRVFGDDPNISYAEGNYEALMNADALLLVTEWNQFRYPDFQAIKDRLKQPVIFDGRNQYNPAEMKELGLSYDGIGRKV
ncbi:MAG: UDP binding domain-containing protein, partial [Candidatus Cloacimonadales bacterium]|nr:UDP binding domain-containing protein [Candidatus Cloacimonadales bacterium]